MAQAELNELQDLLAGVPAPHDPLDVVALDGFLCGVLVQPRPIAESRWLRHVTDAEGRALPHGFDAGRLQALVRRRHAELDRAIGARQWFDPWVFEHEADELDAGAEVVPWVMGLATAFELFPALTEGTAPELTEPLALLYRHLDVDDLEDADAVLAEIETMEPAADLAEAVEGLVRAILLLADIGRPLGLR